MNNKGFTVVELITTFVIIGVIATLLIQITINLSDLYNKTSVKTELYYKQSIISKNLNEAFLNNSIISINSCGVNCLDITYSDYSKKQIKIEDNLIFIGDEAFELVKNSKIGDTKIDIIYSPVSLQYKNDTILNIKIPIKYNGIDNDFGINLVYQYNRTKVSVTL